jgi:hypothetical protein
VLQNSFWITEDKSSGLRAWRIATLLRYIRGQTSHTLGLDVGKTDQVGIDAPKARGLLINVLLPG